MVASSTSGARPWAEAAGVRRRRGRRPWKSRCGDGTEPAVLVAPSLAVTSMASAHVAEAAGFPARGWTSFGVTDE